LGVHVAFRNEAAGFDDGVGVADNSVMEISGHVQNGVVVFDGRVTLPEGAAVTVRLRSTPVIRVAKHQKRVEFPLVPSSAPGSIELTNERIAEILDEEDIEGLKRSWNASS
jgi:hypothetical protein